MSMSMSNIHHTQFTLGCTAYQASSGSWMLTNPYLHRSPRAGKYWLEPRKKGRMSYFNKTFSLCFKIKT